MSHWLKKKKKKTTCNTGGGGDAGSIPGSEDPLEEEMETHSSILAWEIPRTEEPGGVLQSMGVTKRRTKLSMITQQ